MSELDNKLLNLIINNSEITRNELSIEVNAPYSTIQKRITSLKEKKIITEGMIVNLDKSEFPHLFWLYIETKYVSVVKDNGQIDKDDNKKNENYQNDLCDSIIKEINENYANKLILTDKHIMFGGDWDIVLMLRGKNPNDLAEFVVEYLRREPVVIKTTTAWSV